MRDTNPVSTEIFRALPTREMIDYVAGRAADEVPLWQIAGELGISHNRAQDIWNTVLQESGPTAI